jgi:sialic acid synthase SpsE
MGDIMTVKVIAEIGVNWEGPSQLDGSAHPLDNAQAMILYAKEAGASGVKFQLFNEETIKDSPLKDRLSKLILTEQNIDDLHEHVKRIGLDFVLTPMYLEAVDIAAKYADLIKIRFKDNENLTLIDKALGTGKPVLVSVPGPMLATVERQWAFSLRTNQLYCIPKYPPEPEDFNLDQACACKGVSLHFPHTLFDLAFAINRIYDDVYIEKHVMLGIGSRAFFTKESLENPGPTAEIYFKPEPIDAAVSIGFDELANFIKQLQLIERIKRTRL